MLSHDEIYLNICRNMRVVLTFVIHCIFMHFYFYGPSIFNQAENFSIYCIGLSKCPLVLSLKYPLSLSLSLSIYIYIYIFPHTTCESTCDTLSSSAANQGDNTVSAAQGGTATPGATMQLLPPDRVFKRNIYLYYTRSTKSRHYIGRSFIFILAQFVI